MSEFDYMAPKIAALRKTSHKFTLMTLSVIGSLVLIFIIWAIFADIDVLTRGQGQVIPSQKTQVISHLEGGIVQKILVKEGDLVEAGQVLMIIDSTVAKSKYKTNREQYLRYLAITSRLHAQLDNKDYQVPEEVQKEAPPIAQEERHHYLERKQQFETQKAIAQDAVIQKQHAIEEDKEKIKQIKEQLSLAEEELAMVAPLVVEELISKREILRLKRDTANIKGDFSTAKASLLKDQAALAQAQDELIQVTNRFRNEDEEQLKDLKIKLSEEEWQVLESQDRLKRTEILSPVKGVVKEIKIKTVGGVVRSGEEIFTVVPFEDTLLVEARVLPSDIAFLHTGQQAKVKASAYDYSIYGSLNGRVIEISADTVHDPEQKRDFYRILIQTDKNYLEYKGKKLAMLPGMIVDVDILTGERTVMQYLLKPFIRGASESFSEK
jgi:adhesin transport system membrane fusion protein